MTLPLPTLIQLVYLVAASLFILGLRKLGSPATAPRGNLMAAIGMALAVIATLIDRAVLSYELIGLGIITATVLGAIAARKVKMTAMPQMVGLFNGFGGGASALVASAEYLRMMKSAPLMTPEQTFTIQIGVLVGAVTFSGSLIAFGKLQGIVYRAPLVFPLQKLINAALLIGFVMGTGYIVYTGGTLPIFLSLIGISLVLGILFVLPIGGADMPVVISLLNSFSGMAASAAGFVLQNNLLIIAGALVGASGLILTQIMCKAMNRSLLNVLFSGFGGGEQAQGSTTTAAGKTVRSVDAAEAAMVLGFARNVIIVPGYGMAVAQAQHAVRELADELEQRNVTVKYAIHPVAGRMPGHMNVLLAEADVPYPQLYDMDDINPEFERADVALVIGANDVVNPAARNETGSPIYGMPILNVDKAQSIIVIKRSLNPGFAGIDNELFYNEKTMMLFGGARDMVSALKDEVKQL